MENKSPYYKQLRRFIQSAIRQRQLLIDSGRSKANTMLMLTAIDQLNKYLSYYPYNTNEQIAKFFLRHKNQIRLILPGEGSSCNIKRERDYYMHLSR